MKYKGLLLDIDHTIYDYNKAHIIAFDHIIQFFEQHFQMNKKLIKEAFSYGREQVHLELSNTASSHNRLLYFQKMLEFLNINPLSYAFQLYNIYWDHFLEAIEPFQDIYQLLEKYQQKICLITDLTAHIQYRKIKILKLDHYCNQIVTSEEAGIEKPHPYIFFLALKKLNLQVDEVCMIGDSYKKDMLGAVKLGIEAIWFNHEKNIKNTDSDKIKEAQSVSEIIKLV